MRNKERHIEEIKEMQERVRRETILRHKWSREIMELRNLEKTYHVLKEYAKADRVKMRAD